MEQGSWRPSANFMEFPVKLSAQEIESRMQLRRISRVKPARKSYRNINYLMNNYSLVKFYMGGHLLSIIHSAGVVFICQIFVKIMNFL